MYYVLWSSVCTVCIAKVNRDLSGVEGRSTNVCIELKLAAGLRFFEAKAVAAAAAEKLLLASIKAGREAATDRQVMA